MSEPASIQDIITGKDTALGIEFGSTRIKAVLIGPDHDVIATGSHAWENRLVDGLWSYPLDEVAHGVQSAYADLVAKVATHYGVTPTGYGAIGISAMMHGYLAFDADGQLLVPFRTWRNVSTGPAVEELTRLFGVNIPHRWSIAHLHQAVLNGEEHVARIDRITTLAGYVHQMLTGRHVLGVGDASGIFPIDSTTLDYDADCVADYDALVEDRVPWTLTSLLPQVLAAGDPAGVLTEEGARFLDPTGALEAGIALCPPEGDAGTGMVATNAVAPRTGNVSAGTSVFAMVVLDRAIEGVHVEIDQVATPDGAPVAMVHSNNGASELDTWVGVFAQFARLAGVDLEVGDLYDMLYRHALTGAADGAGVLSYNLLAAEPILGVDAGCPMVLHAPAADLDLATFMRTQLMAVFAPLRVGMDILTREDVVLDRLLAHGGIFKTAGVAQKILADTVRTPVAVGETAGEGGAWGIAVLARFAACRDEGESLPHYLDKRVFATAQVSVIEPDEADASACERYMELYLRGAAAVDAAAAAYATEVDA